jgi:MFS transporter, DHA2 family, multidrug resistance protein
MVSSQSGAVSRASEAQGLTLWHITILIILTFVTILYSMTVTIANVALPDIRGALSATQDQVTWIVTANIVATAVATPMAGWLASRFGIRPVLLAAVTGFTLSSVLCGAATSLAALVLFRIGQGLFGAAMVPLSQAFLMRNFPSHLHNAAMSIWGVGAVLGPIIAPTVGGYLSELYGWRWVFLMIVPFGLVALVGVFVVVRENVELTRTRLDWTGFLLLSLAISALQFLVDRGERNGWLESAETIIEICIVAGALYIFVVHTFTAKNSFVNPRLFLDRNYNLGLLLVLSFGMLNFTPMVLFPPLLQELRGYPQSVVGLLLAARGIGTLLAFATMFFLGRVDPRIPMTFGFLLQGISGYFMAQFDINLTTWDVAWTGFVQGVGVGFSWIPLSVIAFATLNPQLMNQGAAFFHLLRNIGSSIYISLSVVVLLHTAKVHYAISTGLISPFNKLFDLPFISGLWNTETTTGLAALSGEIQRQGLMIGYINAFYMFTITSFLTVPLIWLLRAPKKS